MKKYLIALSLLAFATTSCYEKLNITPPNNITNEQVMELLETADDATVVTILGALADGLPPYMYGSGYNFRYSGMIDNSWTGQLLARTNCGNDVVVGYLSQPDDNYYNCEDVTSENSTETPSWWHRAFGMTVQANKVLNIITDQIVAKNGSAKLKEYQGRAYIIRAFGYLYGMETFGTSKLGLSIYTKYDLGQPIVKRASALETYDSILAWATKADERFAAAGIGYGASATSILNRGLTQYVIARAALLAATAEGATPSKYYTLALNASNAVVTNGGLSLMTQDQYVQQQSGTTTINGVEYPVWKAETSGFMNSAKNPETAYGFGWQYGGAGYDVSDNSMYGGSHRIDDRLFNKIDDNDYRKMNFHKEKHGTLYYPGVNSFIDGGTSEGATYWTTKFANNVGLGGAVGNSSKVLRNRTDYSFIRLSEFILMKAEAQLQLGDEGGAKATLNTLLAARTKTGATTLTCDNYAGMSGLSTLEKIQLQTRIEFWGEKGLEWFNNRRWGIPVNRAGSTVHWNTASTYPVSLMTMKIPSEELAANPGVQQNP